MSLLLVGGRPLFAGALFSLVAASVGVIPDGYTEVTNQSEFDLALNAGDGRVWVTDASVNFTRSWGGVLNSDLIIAGTLSSDITVSMTGGTNASQDFIVQGLRVNPGVVHAGTINRVEYVDCYHYDGVFSWNASVDRNLRAKLELTGLNQSPVVGEVLTNSLGDAISDVQAVYDYNSGAGTATVAMNDNPGQATGGTSDSASANRFKWRVGQTFSGDGGLTGTVTSTTGLANGDHALHGGYGVDNIQRVLSHQGGWSCQHMAYRNCVAKGVAQAYEISAAQTMEIIDCTLTDFTEDVTKFKPLSATCAITVTGLRFSYNMANSSYMNNPHCDVFQMQSSFGTHTGPIVIKNILGTSFGHITDTGTQGFLQNVTLNDVTISGMVIDTGTLTNGLSLNGSTVNVSFCTFVSSSLESSNGGVRVGAVKMIASDINTSISEVFTGTVDGVSLLLGKGGGTPTTGGAANMYITHYGAATYTPDPNDPIASFVAWATPKTPAAQAAGGLDASGNMRWI